MARIEFARGRAFHAADRLPVDPASFARANPDHVRVVLHPSITLLPLAQPAVSIWARNQPGGEGLPLGKGPETALILRDAAFQVPVRAVGAGDAALLRAVLDGERLVLAAEKARDAEAGHDPQSLLVSLMRAGAIVDAKE